MNRNGSCKTMQASLTRAPILKCVCVCVKSSLSIQAGGDIGRTPPIIWSSIIVVYACICMYVWCSECLPCFCWCHRDDYSLFRMNTFIFLLAAWPSSWRVNKLWIHDDTLTWRVPLSLQQRSTSDKDLDDWQEWFLVHSSTILSCLFSTLGIDIFLWMYVHLCMAGFNHKCI